MNAEPRKALYSPQMLALAVELAAVPYDAAAPYVGEARSRSCGSVLRLSTSGDCRDLGLSVQACAVGQASAGIFARHCEGKTSTDLASTLAEIEAWLAGPADIPDWPDFDLVEPARDFPGRHGAILLPWRAALDALSKTGTQG